MQETWVRSLGRDAPLEKEMATHSSTLAWRIPWREEPGRLQSMGSQRVRHDWATSLSLLTKDGTPELKFWLGRILKSFEFFKCISSLVYFENRIPWQGKGIFFFMWSLFFFWPIYMACGLLVPNQGSNRCSCIGSAESSLLDNQGSPGVFLFLFLFFRPNNFRRPLSTVSQDMSKFSAIISPESF